VHGFAGRVHQGESFTFARDEVVGAAPETDICVNDRSVSREHLAIRQTDAGWTLNDLGSTNGTWTGEMRIDRVTVHHAVVVRTGKTMFRLEPLGEHIEQEMSSAHRFGRMLGASPAMREMFAVLEKVAGSDLPVLIEGETGTGKSSRPKACTPPAREAARSSRSTAARSRASSSRAS
jgi:transcriptional regulator with PAS, ATPase and Fis domain